MEDLNDDKRKQVEKENGERWGIWIDIEGFSSNYTKDSTKALMALGDLLDSLYRIASICYPYAPQRLFIHQLGDGFLIVSDFSERNPSRPISICISIMRFLLSKDVVAKASISTGDFQDVTGCYPDYAISGLERGHLNKPGAGVFRTIPVMGSALINAYNLSGSLHGAQLVLDFKKFEELDNDVKFKKFFFKGKEYLAIDWVHSEIDGVSAVCDSANLGHMTSERAAEKIEKYIKKNINVLSDDWKNDTFNYLSLELS